MLLSTSMLEQFDFARCNNVARFELLVDWVQLWLDDPSRALDVSISSTKGWGVSLCAFLDQLPARPPEQWLAVASELLAERIGMLLALCIDEQPWDSLKAARLFAYVMEQIRQHLLLYGSNKDLTAQDVASSFGISTRRLHRTLKDSGERLGQLLA